MHLRLFLFRLCSLHLAVIWPGTYTTVRVAFERFHFFFFNSFNPIRIANQITNVWIETLIPLTPITFAISSSSSTMTFALFRIISINFHPLFSAMTSDKLRCNFGVAYVTTLMGGRIRHPRLSHRNFQFRNQGTRMHHSGIRLRGLLPWISFAVVEGFEAN